MSNFSSSALTIWLMHKWSLGYQANVFRADIYHHLLQITSDKSWI